MAKGKSVAAASPSADPSYHDWQAKDDLQTLTRAHEISSDPKRHGAVKKHARKQMALTKHVLGGKAMSAGKR